MNAWFVGAAVEAQCDAEAQIRFVVQKARFFRDFGKLMSERQMKVIRRMTDAGPEGFAGGMNARKYVSLSSVSKATATRDLQDLAQQGALVAIGAGRSVRYALNLS